MKETKNNITELLSNSPFHNIINQAERYTNPIIGATNILNSVGERMSELVSIAGSTMPIMDSGIRSAVSNFGNVISHLTERSIVDESLGKTLTYLSDSVITASEFRSNAALDALSVLRDTIISSSNDNLFSSRQIITEAMMGNITSALTSFTSIPKGDISVMASALQSLENVLSNYASEDISQQETEELYADEEISDDEVVEEVQHILNSPEQVLEPAVGKKPRAIRQKALGVIKKIVAYILVSIIFAPVFDHIKEDVDKKIGISQMWEESGVFERIDNLFGLPQSSALTEDEAKSSVDAENTGNQSKRNRGDLLAKIQAIRTYISSAPQDENTGNLLTYLSDLERDVNGKKYGLVFEEHQETIDTVLAEHTPVLTEEPELLIENGGEMNFLLEGDNLAALRLLEKTHRGRIDLIYIDPPYNTGNKDFVYDDCFVDVQDTFRHSKWLSFMGKRLELAKHLLSERGVIFISIDDREQAGLKLLCDSIFDESCFVADVSWQRTYSTRNDSKGIVSEVEHILVYSSKPYWSPNKLPRTEKMNSIYKNPDNDVMPWTSGDAFAADAATHQGMVYAIQHPFTGKMIYPYKGAHWRYNQDEMLKHMSGWCNYELRDLHDRKERADVCGISEDDIRDGVKAIVLTDTLDIASKQAQKIYDRGKWPKFYFTNKGKGGIRRKTYLESVSGKLPTNFWPYSEVGHTDEAKKETGKLLGNMTAFSTPKPVRLMERVITVASQPDSIILDFFAGSGTTGHAVLAHNAAHSDSRRKFILCTNNENNICRNVTYERIKRVIEREGYAASLKYYRIDYVPINEQLYYEYADELLRHVRELVELENGVNFIENAEIAIVLTDEELADFIARPEAFSKCHTLYLGHDILPTGEQDAAIKERGIRVNIIPDYYYRELEG